MNASPRMRWWYVGALLLLGMMTLLFWRGPEPMFTGMDVALHGGWCFVLTLAGNLLVRRTGRPIPEAAVFSGIVLLGIAVEVAQFYLRIDFEAGDIVMDTLGALAGWAAWRLVEAHVPASVGRGERDG